MKLTQSLAGSFLKNGRRWTTRCLWRRGMMKRRRATKVLGRRKRKR